MNEKDLQVIEAQQVTVERDALEIIETRNALFDRVMKVAIAATNPSDWVDQNGKPYLQASGAEKVARRFGIRIFDIAFDREDLDDDNGRYYMYTCMGKAALGSGNESVETIGTCSSRDKFFGKVNGKYKPIQDVDISNIKKKAYTNFLGNAITRLLGMRNLTWNELSKYGINKGGGGSVSYKSKAEKASTSKTAQKAEQESKMPFWVSPWQGTDYVNARHGKHFSEEFLANLGMKKSPKGVYYMVSNEEVLAALKDEYEAAEEVNKQAESEAKGA